MSGPRVRFILDTDTVTALQHGNAGVVEQIARTEPEAVATTIVTVYEQLRGRLANVNRGVRSVVALQAAYQGLQATFDFYSQMPVLPFDTLARVRYQELRQRQVRAGPGAQDLQIAAIALARGAILVTNNSRHFGQIAGLRIVSWRS